MMAALRLNIPTIIVSGGPMLAGRFKGKAVDLISVFEGVGRVAAGTMTKQELSMLEECACPGAGSCAGMFTANSMNCLTKRWGSGWWEMERSLRCMPRDKACEARREENRRAHRGAAPAERDRDTRRLQERNCVDMAFGGSSNTACICPQSPMRRA